MSCTPVDSADTTCNDLDDDCDGALDENCDFDPASCPAGYRRIVGTHGNDILTGTSGRDCIVGYGGNDRIRGRDGNDLLIGGPGNDDIEGDGDNDTIRGGAGADKIAGGGGRDTIEGGDGNDRIEGGTNDDTIEGGLCHDFIDGGSGDTLRGNEGSDRIEAPHLLSDINGGAGTDACRGTSCEVSPSTRKCDRDSECGSGKRCVIATGICVVTGSVAFTDPTCNGVDDDCDGRTDENFVGGATTTCGVGECAATGTSACEDGMVVNDCMPGAPAANDASCDASDDDCDGQNDEDFVGGSTTCGVGACTRTGSNSCEDGTVSMSCVPGTPAANDASCNGSDDDCNGHTDEDFASQPTSCGVGACVAAGSTSCFGGNVHDSCTPGTPAANDATCNGIDEDCNGAEDEDFPSAPTSCGVGACLSMGATFCAGGHVQDSCTPGAPAANDATCDAVDDDCNGLIDEDFASEATSCGEGACAATGATSCVMGHVQDSCTPGAGGTNDMTCDGIDDDCSGEADEDFVSMGTTCGVGACASAGATSCVGGHVQDSCTPSTGSPSDFTCDGVDDDCSGEADEDYSSHATTCGIGSCGANGASSCVDGVEQENCTPGTPATSDPTCDGFDDDCDGESDEEYLNLGTNCGTGACADTGATSCVNGEVLDSCEPGTPAANDATCDGSDDDCNGQTDEDFAPACSGTVRLTCADGMVEMFDCSDGDLCTGAETCSAGVCAPGTPPVIDDGNPCTTDSCTGGVVTHTDVPSGTSCSDGEVCDGEEVCLPGGAPGCATVPPDADSWWKAEGNANDSLGGHHGTLLPVTGPTTFTAGQVGQAFSFDGVNDAVSVSPHAAALNYASHQATIEVWFRTAVDACRTVFALRTDATHDQYLQLGAGCASAPANALVTWTQRDGAATSVVSYVTTNRSALNGSAYHHLAVTFDGTTTRMYLDGANVPVTAAPGMFGTNFGDWGFASSTPVGAIIGARANLDRAAAPFFSGQLDEVTLYDRPLSATEIFSIFNAGSAGKCDGSGAMTCSDGADAPAGTMCEEGGMCDGNGVCEP